MAGVISSGWVSHSRVEPSTSANSNVTVPVGKSPLTASSLQSTSGVSTRGSISLMLASLRPTRGPKHQQKRVDPATTYANISHVTRDRRGGEAWSVSTSRWAISTTSVTQRRLLGCSASTAARLATQFPPTTDFTHVTVTARVCPSVGRRLSERHLGNVTAEGVVGRTRSIRCNLHIPAPAWIAAADAADHGCRRRVGGCGAYKRAGQPAPSHPCSADGGRDHCDFHRGYGHLLADTVANSPTVGDRSRHGDGVHRRVDCYPGQCDHGGP